MKGTTELHVTQATIVAAVQLYLDTQFVMGRSPVVMSVKPKNGVGNGDGYSIVAEERKVEERILAAGPYAMTDRLGQRLEVLPDPSRKYIVGGEQE